MDQDFIFDRIFVKLAGNEDNHKVPGEFDLGQIGLCALELLAKVERWKTKTKQKKKNPIYF